MQPGSWIPPRSGSRRPGSSPCNEVALAGPRPSQGLRSGQRTPSGPAKLDDGRVCGPALGSKERPSVGHATLKETQLLQTARLGSHQEAMIGSSRQIKLWGQ